MIGQIRLQRQISNQISLGKFPEFVIFVAPRGAGKSLLAKKVARQLEAECAEFDTTVEEIREMIETAYTISTPVVYAIRNVDNMSPSAFNSLLKVVEEPPKFARFILTCENIENVPTTIRSRAVVYQFDPYTQDELYDFCELKDIPKSEFNVEIADTPGDLIILKEFSDLENFVNVVILNIATVSGANAFKIADRVDIKGENNGKFDLKLFWRAFALRCTIYMLEKDVDNSLQFGRAVAITNDAIGDLNSKSINRTMLFDKWLLDVRSEWM